MATPRGAEWQGRTHTASTRRGLGNGRWCRFEMYRETTKMGRPSLMLNSAGETVGETRERECFRVYPDGRRVLAGVETLERRSARAAGDRWRVVSYMPLGGGFDLGAAIAALRAQVQA